MFRVVLLDQWKNVESTGQWVDVQPSVVRGMNTVGSGSGRSGLRILNKIGREVSQNDLRMPTTPPKCPNS